MRIHTNLADEQIAECLATVQSAGLVSRDVRFAEYSRHASRTHEGAVDVQLGAATGGNLPEGYVNQYGKRQKRRRVRTGGGGWGTSHYPGGELRFAATWEEWGHFLARIFDVDPEAKTNVYADRDDFDRKTDWKFDTDEIGR